VSSTAVVDLLAVRSKRWSILRTVVLVGGLVVFLLGSAGVIPFPVGFVVFGACFPLVMFIDIQQLWWTEDEFRRLVRRPTWSDATGGALDVAHPGEPWVFPGEGRFGRRAPARPSRVLLAFDEEAFVVLDCSRGLNRLRRRVVVPGRQVEFAVETVGSGGCVLEERVSGMRVRLLAGSVGPVTDHGSEGHGRARIADRLTRALASTGWI
jgi:hypothetical protein